MFVAVVVTLLVLDLGVLHKDDREIEVKKCLLLSAGYISIAVGFGVWVWWFLGAQSGTEYFTGFLIEKSLSMDNVFVIALIFSYFAIPRQYQHRVLFWGILGVIVLRAIMIGLGATLISQFSPGAGVHRQQDLPGRLHRQDPASDLAGRDLRADRRGRARVAVEDPRCKT